MFNDTFQFIATEGSRKIEVDWSRSHIAGCEKTFNTNGKLYCITVYTTVKDKTGANKQFLLFDDEAKKFLTWFHDSY